MMTQATAQKSWLKDLDPPEFLVAAWERQMKDLMNASLRRHGLRLVEWRLLQCVEAEADLTICDLAERAVLERTVTSRLVDKLAEQGLIHKSMMKHDRRFAQITLLEPGRSLLEVCSGEVDAIRERLFEGFSANDIAQFNATVLKLLENAIRASLRR